MITEQDLQEAIAECQGKRNPDANTCIKLAAFLIIRREMYGSDQSVDAGNMVPTYSYAAPPVEQVETHVNYQSDSDFSRAINGMEAVDVWPVIDELMTTLQAIYPRLYTGVMRQLAK